MQCEYGVHDGGQPVVIHKRVQRSNSIGWFIRDQSSQAGEADDEEEEPDEKYWKRNNEKNRLPRSGGRRLLAEESHAIILADLK